MDGTELTTEKVADPKRFESPTSLGIKLDGMIFISGMMPWDLEREVVGPGDIQKQTKKALHNLESVLQAADATLQDIVKITFYLVDIRHKKDVWKVRKEMFGGHRPASTLVAVKDLVDPQALLEVEAIAYKE